MGKKHLPILDEVQPSGPVTQAREPVPVRVWLRWFDGTGQASEATAVAWTATEVLVHIASEHGGRGFDAWLSASDVRRVEPGQER